MMDLIELPDVSGSEMKEMMDYRLGRIRGVMKKNDISLCVLTNPVNMRYAVDFNEYMMFMAHIPTAALFIPLEGPVTLFGASHTTYPNVDEYRKSRFITPFDGGLDLSSNCQNFVSDIEAYLNDYKLKDAGSRIAVERVSPLVINLLNEKGHTIVDGEAVVESAKLIKNDTELKCIRHSIAVAELGIKQMHEALRPGLTENQLWSIIHQVNIANGGEWIEGKMLASGPRTNPWLQEATSRVINSGDMVAFDTDMIGPMGYLADISRSWICGGGSGTAEQRHAYRHAYDEIHYNMELLRPGVSFAELSDKAFPRLKEYRDQRYVCAFHGSGMSDEYPKIYYSEDWTDNGFAGELLPNMVMCVESYSGVVGGKDGVKLEEMVLVTENGIEKLSSYPFETELLR